MASPAQCFYCFETLASSFENEEPPSLAAIEESWWHYNQAKSDKAWVILELYMVIHLILNELDFTVPF
jgi:hypothetical protein